jgi:hypothetical protein
MTFSFFVFFLRFFCFGHEKNPHKYARELDNFTQIFNTPHAHLQNTNVVNFTFVSLNQSEIKLADVCGVCVWASVMAKLSWCGACTGGLEVS